MFTYQTTYLKQYPTSNAVLPWAKKRWLFDTISWEFQKGAHLPWNSIKGRSII